MTFTIPPRPWAQMTDQELARELRLLPNGEFVERLIRVVDRLQEAERTLSVVRSRLTDIPKTGSTA